MFKKQLGHASAEMTRRYQRRRDRFRVNLTKAARAVTRLPYPPVAWLRMDFRERPLSAQSH